MALDGSNYVIYSDLKVINGTAAIEDLGTGLSDSTKVKYRIKETYDSCAGPEKEISVS